MDNQKRATEEKAEHILVCLSASPSNAKIIRTAAKMAEAFGGSFTALHIRTPDFEVMSEQDKERLQKNIRLASQLGADIATVQGDAVPYQIAEFARLSAVTKIVIGRSNTKRRHFWSKPTLTERLIEAAPGLDIYIIPDSQSAGRYHIEKNRFADAVIPSFRDMALTVLLLALATGIGFCFLRLGFTDSNVITVYLLGVLLTSILTRGYTCSVVSAVLSVALFNFFLVEPRLTFYAYGSGYPVTFAIMITASVITATLASKLKSHAKLSARSAFRTKVLFDTNRLLQNAKDDEGIINVTAGQLLKLLDRDIIVYPEKDGLLMKGYVFTADEKSDAQLFFSPQEKQAAEWVFENKKRAGASTEVLSSCGALYLAIKSSSRVYGVVGISIKDTPPDSFENSIILSILGECALAIENSRNAREKEQAAVMAKNEKLRANLLRTISHDLRTPLTSIAGNADTLLSSYDRLDRETLENIFGDISRDSQWLMSLIENILSVTRIEQGRMQLNMSVQLVDEVIEEALRHRAKGLSRHSIVTEYKDELMLAAMDARLIMQVIVNLVDNAVKYTPEGTQIKITACKQQDMICVSVSDLGNGIPDSAKAQVFEMFFTGESTVADSQRSLGLGLALCKSIINIHGGEIKVSDNSPRGCVFTFTLPSDEVIINEQGDGACC